MADAFPAWLTTITTRLAIDRARIQRRQAVILRADVPEQHWHMSTVDPTHRLVLREALNQLSAEHRAALLLHVRDGYEYQEIAQGLGIPIGTVKSRIANAKRALRAALDDRTEAKREEDSI